MYKELAIIAPTASGKTALSIGLAHKLNAVILSLDSLAVYEQIDIASAKPTISERDGIMHFGIDKVLPNEIYDVIEFIDEYKRAKEYAVNHEKNLIIVGGTGFYLKAMVDGLSTIPKISDETKALVSEQLVSLDDTYEMLKNKDIEYMKKIKLNDKYRIQKALEIYIQTSTIPSEYFNQNKPKPVINDLKIFNIQTDVDILRARIRKRTQKMILDGLIDEVILLEQKYTRSPNSMSSIGISETLKYLDGRINKQQLEDLITIHTGQLAKRQRTFNKSQFCNFFSDNLDKLEEKIINTI